MSLKTDIAALAARVDHLEEELSIEEAAGDVEVEESPYANDPLRFINECCYTSDPRKIETGDSTRLPFTLFPKQSEFIRWVQNRLKNREDGLVEKSRDSGLSWLICAFFVWAWLFRPGFAAGLGSRKEQLVDQKGDPKSLFWKIRFIIEHLPLEMLPAGYNEREHDNYMRLVNPANGATITGEAGDNMGRGGRFTMYFGDEWAFVPRAHLPKRAISQATNCFIRGSTPNGMGNDFAETRFSGKIPVFTFHWRDDPRKDEAWYEAQKAKHDEVTVAQEIDIDYSASVEGIFIPARYVQAALKISLSPEGVRRAGLDVAAGGKALNVYTARCGPVVTHIESWQGSDPTLAAHQAAAMATADQAERLYYDADGVGSGIAGVYQGYEVPVPFRYVPVRGGASPTVSRHDDAPNLRAKERFRNLRAELWWSLRTRFRKTWEVVEGKATYPDDELICIDPNLPHVGTLVQQLSMPLRVPTNTGKIQVESKEDMRKRGVVSPDYADSLVYCFAHAEPPATGAALTSFRGGGKAGGGLTSLR